MKTKHFFMTALVILLLAVLYTQSTKEGFLADYCAKNKTCMDCSSASGCSWCPKSNVCLTSTTLKSTDAMCNQNNTIASSFRCPSARGVEPPTLPESIASNDVLYDFSLYKNRITDKIPPPNLYMAGEMKVSNEDLLSNMNDVRNDIANYKIEMPSIIASTVEQNIKPMVKGILSENYYIQGFEDMSKSKLGTTNPHNIPTPDAGNMDPAKPTKSKEECNKLNSCNSCLNNNACGWNPRGNNCEARGPNNKWQITQPSKCVLTSTTIGSMTSRPGGNV